MKNQPASVSLGTWAALLFLLFLGLRLGKVTAWSWWWVTSPLWIYGALGLSVILFAIICVTAFGSDVPKARKR